MGAMASSPSGTSPASQGIGALAPDAGELMAMTPSAVVAQSKHKHHPQ